MRSTFIYFRSRLNLNTLSYVLVRLLFNCKTTFILLKRQVKTPSYSASQSSLICLPMVLCSGYVNERVSEIDVFLMVINIHVLCGNDSMSVRLGVTKPIKPLGRKHNCSSICKQPGSSWDAEKISVPWIQPVWRLDNIFTSFERHWSTLNIEAGQTFSRQQFIWRAKG